MSRRAALRELAVLDPEVDHLRITQPVVGRPFADRVFTELLTTAACWRQTAIPAMARILARRGDAHLLAAVGQPSASSATRTLTSAATRAYVAGRRVVPGPDDRERVVAPWTKAYGPHPNPSETGPEWAAGIGASTRRHATVGKRAGHG